MEEHGCSEKKNRLGHGYGIMEGSKRKMVAAFRQFIEVDNHKALVFADLLDQHRVVKEVVGPAFDKANVPNAKKLSTRRAHLESWEKKASESLRGHHDN